MVFALIAYLPAGECCFSSTGVSVCAAVYENISAKGSPKQKQASPDVKPVSNRNYKVL